MKKTVKLVVDAGIVPANALEQLVRWKLLPPELASSTGKSLAEKGWNSVEEFITDLRGALEAEDATVRETELDHVGSFKAVTLISKEGKVATEAFIDKLGRVAIPGRFPINQLKAVAIEDGPQQFVVRVEPRYKGDDVTTWVIYLEERETDELPANAN
jgi:hypothetical protein